MLTVQKFTFNPFSENTYVVFDENGLGTIIDPGCYNLAEKDALYNFIANNNIKIKSILNTHCHIDHVLGNFWAIKQYEAPLYIHSKEINTLKSIPLYAGSYGFSAYEVSPEPTDYLTVNKAFKIGQNELEIRFVPGHSPGHIVFISHQGKWVINGDCLFDGGIGRTDLPGGDHQTLLTSIKEQLFTLPDDYTVYCGHGPETTIGKEKSSNPFMMEV